MADLTVKIDGDLSLDDIRDRCEFEQDGGFQLSAMKGDSKTVGNKVLLFNNSEFTSKSSAKILRKLTFVPVGNKKPEDIKKDMEDKGQKLVLDVSEIFSARNAIKVMVFGKKS